MSWVRVDIYHIIHIPLHELNLIYEHELPSLTWSCVITMKCRVIDQKMSKGPPGLTWYFDPSYILVARACIRTTPKNPLKWSDHRIVKVMARGESHSSLDYRCWAISKRIKNGSCILIWFWLLQVWKMRRVCSFLEGYISFGHCCNKNMWLGLEEVLGPWDNYHI
jgi:hypothetical protein